MAQVNAHVGDISANAEMILSWSAKAAEADADLVLFPEMCLTGYPVEDLALRATFVEASRRRWSIWPAGWTNEGLGGLTVVVGYLDRADDGGADGRGLGQDGQPKPQNAAAVLHRGRSSAGRPSTTCPNYGVFDEYRYFAPGDVLAGGPGPRRGRGDRHLRGPLARRRPGGRDPRGRRPDCSR